MPALDPFHTRPWDRERLWAAVLDLYLKAKTRADREAFQRALGAIQVLGALDRLHVRRGRYTASRGAYGTIRTVVPAGLREIIAMLGAGHGLTEIARMLGAPVSTAGNRINRTRRLAATGWRL